MPFTKGHKINVGRHPSIETIEKIRQSNLGKKKTTKHNKQFKKGHSPWNKGLKNCYSEEHLQKLSNARRKRIISEETKLKTSESMKGENSPWYGKFGEEHNTYKGGRRLALARQRSKRREKGFELISDKQPYNEEIEYHHISKTLPYVVPCPKRINQMFGGKYHYQNVNAMLGIKIGEELNS